MTTEPNQDLEWTGERYVPQIRGTIALEHLHRYAYASEYVKSRVVLDIASGEGYGSEMLSRTSKHVYGVDIDAASVAHAKAKYSSDKLTFLQGSCTDIPLKDESVDVVVSFETIEHITDHDRMMREVKRVLRPGGILIMSSPERHEYSEVPKHENPFHLKELDQEEFLGLLKKYFKHSTLLGQRVVHGSALLPMGKPSAPAKTYQFEQLPRKIEAASGLSRPIYLIGVCSDHPIQVPSGGICEQDINQSETVRAYQKIVTEREGVIAEKEGVIAEKEGVIAEKEGVIAEKEGVIAEKEGAIAEKEGVIAEKEGVIAQQASVIAEKEGVIAEKEGVIAEKEGAIAEKEGVIAEKEGVIAQQASVIAEKEGVITEKEGVIAEIEWVIAEKEGEIAEKCREIVVLSETVANRDSQISGIRGQIAEKEELISQRDHDLHHLRAYLDLMKSSWSWRLTAPLRAVQEKVKFVVQTLKRYRLAAVIIWTHRKTGIFDPEWYLLRYPDVRKSGINPWWHFAMYGIYEGRSPNQRFQPGPYTTLNQDIASSEIPPILHYVLFGYREKRISNWLDQYIEIHHGREERIRISNLLDTLLIGGNEKDEARKDKKKINTLHKRLKKLLHKHQTNIIAPQVTVIIPVYNQLSYTLACLISLFESEPKTDFEVIIADDCSTDETSAILPRLSNSIRVIRTPGNLGFLKNCNHAAKKAKGELVVFLNNDMVLLPDWLDSLVDTISKESECGMVGSKLLNLDGTLQEAGGIFWNDGSAWNYGRGQNPMAPEYNYKKEVDYCSGASICLRKGVWEAVGGFDEIYAPAYCEESDLAFRLRARGLKTIYQPRSVGIHLEGISCGTDTTQGIKAYQVGNLKKLKDRWSDVLKKEHFPNAEKVFLARDRSAKKRRMLFVDHYLPRPDFDAGSKQMATYLQLFVEMGFQISFWPDNLSYDKEYARPLEELGIEVINCNADFMVFDEWINKNGKYLDVAFLSRPYVALKYIQGLKENSEASIVFYGHDIHSLRTKGELEYNPGDQELLARLSNEEDAEIECWQKSDVILYPSTEEIDYISGKLPLVNVDILPLYCKSEDEILNSKTTTGFYDRSGILFVGGFDHSPNKDGILWFCKEILPLIRRISPDVTLTIAGSNPPEEVRSLENDFIKVKGHVSDQTLSALYENHRVAIAPLRFGGGVKGKVVESMLKGLPMVTTKIGSQGLNATGKDLAIAYSECEFADKVIELLKDEKKWLQKRYSGETFFIENFSLEKIKNNLKTTLVSG